MSRLIVMFISGKGMICCGDDKGSLWLYNLPQYGKDGSAPAKGVIEPTTKLAWPELQDDHLVSFQRKKRADSQSSISVAIGYS